MGENLVKDREEVMADLIIFLFKLSFGLGLFAVSLVAIAHIITALVELLSSITTAIVVAISKIVG